MKEQGHRDDPKTVGRMVGHTQKWRPSLPIFHARVLIVEDNAVNQIAILKMA